MKTSSGIGEGLIRLKVSLPKSRTTISLDDVLYQGLCRVMGGGQEADAWLRAQAVEIARLIVEVGVGSPPVDVDAGLSRLVQRQAMRQVIEALSVGATGSASPG